MKKQFPWAAIIVIGLLAFHACIIVSDVQQVIEDPNQTNKPREIFKLVVDLTRYFG